MRLTELAGAIDDIRSTIALLMDQTTISPTILLLMVQRYAN
jgi:hypothetical protein